MKIFFIILCIVCILSHVIEILAHKKKGRHELLCEIDKEYNYDELLKNHQKKKKIWSYLDNGSWCIGVISIIIIIVLLIVLVFAYSEYYFDITPWRKGTYTEEYNSLVFKTKDNYYREKTGRLKEGIVEEIYSWNEKIADKKKDKWIYSIFPSLNIYKDFQTIDYKVITNGG